MVLIQDIVAFLWQGVKVDSRTLYVYYEVPTNTIYLSDEKHNSDRYTIYLGIL